MLVFIPALLLLAASANETTAAAPSSRLAVISPAPEFDLTDQDGKPFRLSDLQGKVRLVSFIFTTCNGTCPATTHRMCQVQQELKQRRLDPARIQLLSLTLDPARDTPEVLRGYAQLYDIDFTNWSMVTGPTDRVNAVIRAWGMWARPSTNGQLDHPSRVYLVDPHGRIREIYNLNFLKPKWVADDIELLLREP